MGGCHGLDVNVRAGKVGLDCIPYDGVEAVGIASHGVGAGQASVAVDEVVCLHVLKADRAGDSCGRDVEGRLNERYCHKASSMFRAWVKAKLSWS